MAPTQETPETSETHERGRMSLPGVISALVVVAVLALLVGLLITRADGTDEAQTAQLDEQLEEAGVLPDELLAELEATALAGTAATAEAEAADPVPAEAPAPPTGVQLYTAPPPMEIDPEGSYQATIETPRGPIVIELLPEIAPQTVNNFVFLAQEGFYDGLTWHRVIPGFMAQGGDPLGDGTGGPGYSVPAEFTSDILFDRPGLVAMARSNDPNSAGSQFFITTAPAPHLNEQYTIFGEVIEGLDTAVTIPVRDPMSSSEPGEAIESITISES